MLSENGIASSKRVLGGICLLVVLAAWVYVIIKEGLTENAKDLAEMMIGTAGLLLGISSVTSIWKENKNNDEETEH